MSRFTRRERSGYQGGVSSPVVAHPDRLPAILEVGPYERPILTYNGYGVGLLAEGADRGGL